MTRKDYIQFAAIIKSHECPNGSSMDKFGGWNQSRDELRDRLAEFFATDNSRFDKDRFVTACSDWGK